MSESRVAPDASAAEAGRAFRAPTRSLRRPSLATALGIATAIGLALALAAVYHAPETRTEPLQPDSRLWRILLGVGVLGCFVTYVLGLAALRRRAVALTAVIGVAVAIQLAPLATPLLISRDTYLYWAYGREAVIHHANPYDVFPDRFASDPAYRLSSSS